NSSPLGRPSVDGTGHAPGNGVQKEDGWGALCDGKPAFGHWLKEEFYLHINCLEMLGHHFLVRLDSLAVVSYINHQGGLSSKRFFILVEHILEWAQLSLHSLRAMDVLDRLNKGADMLSRSKMIWEIFGKAEVDLFASEDNSHCLIFYSKDRDALAYDWPYLLLYAFPLIIPDPTGNQANRGASTQGSLGDPLWKNQHWLSELTQRLVAAPWPNPLRQNLLSQAIWDGSLQEHVLNSILKTRALYTRHLYARKWSVFSAWCLNREDPSTSDLPVVLAFLLDKGRSLSTFKVHVASIAAFHDPIAGQSGGQEAESASPPHCLHGTCP
ncbi:hypothetical protein M9458_026178, partial [Cirrhinus mrigala]